MDLILEKKPTIYRARIVLNTRDYALIGLSLCGACAFSTALFALMLASL